MAEFASLKSKRTAIKAKLTRFKIYFDSINKESLESNTINDLCVRLEKRTSLGGVQ